MGSQQRPPIPPSPRPLPPPSSFVPPLLRIPTAPAESTHPDTGPDPSILAESLSFPRQAAAGKWEENDDDDEVVEEELHHHQGPRSSSSAIQKREGRKTTTSRPHASGGVMTAAGFVLGCYVLSYYYRWDSSTTGRLSSSTTTWPVATGGSSWPPAIINAGRGAVRGSMNGTTADEQAATSTGSESGRLNDHSNDDIRKDVDTPNSEVVWLMSFPNSGTSYTIMNTERLSQRSTASNYARDYARLVPVRSELNDAGPFLHNPHLFAAPHKVLTKTHCGGYCIACEPPVYVHTVASFDKACRTGDANDGVEHGDKNNKTQLTTTYPRSVPSGAVHLVRNPFDNLVARMHLALNRKVAAVRNSDTVDRTWMPPPEAMGAWCEYVDGLHSTDEDTTALIPDDVKWAWDGLPCRSEWFRWVQWHNKALEVISRYQSERPDDNFSVHRLYYEDYTTSYNATVTALFKFLELDVRGSPVPFHPGKTYPNYFSEEDRRHAARFVKIVATPDCWNMVKHYFDGMLD